MQPSEYDELIRDGLISDPADDIINKMYHDLCDRLEAAGMTQAQAITVANKRVLEPYFRGQ